MIIAGFLTWIKYGYLITLSDEIRFAESSIQQIISEPAPTASLRSKFLPKGERFDLIFHGLKTWFNLTGNPSPKIENLIPIYGTWYHDGSGESIIRFRYKDTTQTLIIEITQSSGELFVKNLYIGNDVIPIDLNRDGSINALDVHLSKQYRYVCGENILEKIGSSLFHVDNGTTRDISLPRRY